MFRAIRGWLTVLLVVSLPPAAGAQIRPPSSPTGGLFGSRVVVDPIRNSEEFTATIDFGTGYDLNKSDDPLALVPTFGVLQSGTVTAATGTANYRVGDALTYFEASGRGYASHASAGIQQLIAGNLDMSGEMLLGLRNGLSTSVNLSYSPTYLFNAFGPLVEQAEGDIAPGATPEQGVNEGRFLSGEGSAGLYRRWTSRQRTDASIGVSRQRPTRGAGLDSDTQFASLRHEWQSTRTTNFQLYYDFRDTQQQNNLLEQAPETSVGTHNLRAGLTLERRWSDTRGFSVTFGGGVALSSTSVAAVDGDSSFATPTAFGGVRADLNRAWVWSADYSRAVSVLTSLTPEPFSTNAVSMRLAGTLDRRVQLLLAAAYSNGGSLITQTAAFQSASGTATIQYAISRVWAVFAGYSFYDYTLEDVNSLQPDFPDNYQRNSIRVGTTLWLPLVGAR